MQQLNNKFKSQRKFDIEKLNSDKNSCAFKSCSRTQRDQTARNRNNTPPAGSYNTDSSHKFLENKTRIKQSVSRFNPKELDIRSEERFQGTTDMNKQDISYGRNNYTAPYSTYSQYRLRTQALKNIYNQRQHNNNVQQLEKFNQTTSDFDFKPRRGSVSAMEPSDLDANTTQATTMSRASGSRSADFSKSADYGTTNENWQFRSLSRTQRNQALETKEEYKKGQSQLRKNYKLIEPRVKGMPFQAAISRSKSSQFLDTADKFYRRNKVLSCN